MSAWLDFSDALKTRIEAAVAVCSPELPDEQRVEVIVDRQKDLDTEIAKAVGRASGACVVILWTGGKNPEPDADTLHMGGGYSIQARGLPILNDSVAGRVPLDELAEQVALALHGFLPEARPVRNPRRLRVLDVDLVPDKFLLIYELTAEVKRVF